MISQLKSVYPNLQYINHLFQSIADAIQKNQVDDLLQRVKSFKKDISKAFQENDEELITCIIHHCIALLKHDSINNPVDLIALAFELDCEQALDVLMMAQRNDDDLLLHFLLECANSNYTDNSKKNKRNIQFEKKIIENLEKNGIVNAHEKIKSLTTESLNLECKQALENNESRTVSYLLKSYKVRLDILFFQRDPKGYANFVHLLSSLDIMNFQGHIESIAHFDMQSFGPMLSLITKDMPTLIQWLCVDMTDAYKNAKKHYDISHDELLDFRNNVLAELLLLKNVENPENVLFNFDESLQEMKLAINDQNCNAIHLFTILFKLLASFSNDVMKNDAKSIAEHIKQLVEVIYEYRNVDALKIIFEWLKINTPHLINSDSDVDKIVLSYLSWALLTTGRLDKFCKRAGMGYSEYCQFKAELFSILNQSYGPIIPNNDDVILSFKHLSNQLNSKEGFTQRNFNSLQLNILIQEYFINQDITAFSDLIQKLANCLFESDLKNSNLALIQILNLNANESKTLYANLKEGCRVGVIAALTTICLRRTFSPAFSKSPTAKANENELSLKKIFQSKIMSSLGVDPKKIKDQSSELKSTWEWKDVKKSEKVPTLDDYKNNLSEIIEKSNFHSLEQKRKLRRELYDYASYHHDVELYKSLIIDDIQLIQEAWQVNKQIEIVCLMNLSAAKVNEISKLLEYGSENDLFIFILHSISHFYFVYGLPKHSTVALKARVYNQLTTKCATPVSELFSQYQQALINLDTTAIDQLQIKFTLSFIENLYKADGDPQQLIQLAAKIALLLQQTREVYLPKRRLMQLGLIQSLTALDLETIDHLMKENELDLIAWHINQSLAEEIFKEDYTESNGRQFPLVDELNNEYAQLIQPQAKPLNLMALLDNSQTKTKQGLLYTPDGLFSKITDAVTNDKFVELRVCNEQLKALIKDSIIKGKYVQIKEIVQKYGEQCLAINKNQQFSALCSLTSFSTKNMAELCYLSKENTSSLIPLSLLSNLIRNNIDTINLLSKREGLLSIREEFFKALYAQFHMGSLLDPNISPYETLIQTHSKEKDLFIFNLHINSLVEYASYCDDAQVLVEVINNLSSIFQKSYKNGQSILICKLLNTDHKQLEKLLVWLNCNYEKGIQDWLLDHYLEKLPYRSFPYSDKKKAFIDKIHSLLGIDKFDLIFIGKTELSKTLEIKEVLSKLRNMANNYVDILKLTSTMNRLAKSPALIDFLNENKPTQNDDDCYHRFHEMMLATWHTHIAAHVHSMLKPSFLLNNFEVFWEGSAPLVMCRYIKDTQLELTHTRSFLKELSVILQHYFKSIQHKFSVNDLLKALNQAMNDNIVIDKTYTLSQIKEKLQNNEILAIPVNLCEPGAQLGHAVAAVFCGDKVMFSDRGTHQFSGMTFYKTSCSDSIAKVITSLIDTSINPITSKDYEELQKQLKLSQVDSITLDHQLMGNCGMASQAEPIHLSIMYFKFLAWARQTQRNEEDSMSLASSLAQMLHNKVMRAMETKSVNTMIDFFNNEHCTIAPPRELFAHIYQVALFKLKNHDVVKRINQTKWVSSHDIDQAYEDVKQHFRTEIEQLLPTDTRKDLHPKALDNEILHLVKIYFDKNIDQDMFIKQYGLSIGRLSAQSIQGQTLLFKFSHFSDYLEALTPRSLIESAVKVGLENMTRDKLEDEMLQGKIAHNRLSNSLSS